MASCEQLGRTDKSRYLKNGHLPERLRARGNDEETFGFTLDALIGRGEHNPFASFAGDDGDGLLICTADHHLIASG